MPHHSVLRLALPCVVVAAAHACNVYTEDLLGEADELVVESGGKETGGTAETGGSTGGAMPLGGLGGIGTGGEPDESGGVETTGGVSATGGDPATGGASATGGSGSTGGESTGGAAASGASGGMDPGGAGGESGVPGTGGAPTGGDSPGGATTGGAPTGGDSPGGATTGGAPTGGAPTGGAPTGGAPTGGAPTGGGSTGGQAGFTVIDMLDEANNTIELQDGEGLWYVFHDGSADGVITPDTSELVVPVTLPTPRDGNLLGVHVVANDLFTSWGAGVGFNLNAPDPDTRRKYDVSSHTGIVFWARADAGTATLRLKVVTADITADTESGGECTSNCSDAFGYVIDLTDAWQEYSVPFSDLTQQGWGYSPPGGFDPTGVLTVQLHADPRVAFDIWLDDIRFFD